jgi:hypothetical protein
MAATDVAVAADHDIDLLDVEETLVRSGTSLGFV